MSFCPSTRGETECTSASKASAVGGSPSGVPSAVPSTASPVTASGVGRSGTTPLHPSRTTVQRVNPTTSPNPPSPVPRGCSNTASSLSRGVVAAAVVSSMEPTVAAATPSRTGSPATTSLPPLPASAAVVAAPHRPSGNQRGAPESTSDTVVLPPLAPTASVLSDGRATATGASFPGGLPSLTPSHVTSSAADVGEREAIHDGAEARRQTGATQETEPLPCSPSSSTALTPTPPSRHASSAAGTTARPPPPASSSSAAEGAPSPSRPASGPYFRENKVPHLFNELSEALLEARPEDPVAFMTEWLRQRRDALA